MLPRKYWILTKYSNVCNACLLIWGGCFSSCALSHERVNYTNNRSMEAVHSFILVAMENARTNLLILGCFHIKVLKNPTNNSGRYSLCCSQNIEY